MSRLIDISLPLSGELAFWPGSPGVTLRTVAHRAEGAAANGSLFTCDVHAGTHVDAPRHVRDDGAGAEMLPLDALVGPAIVVDVAAAKITARVLEGCRIGSGATRVILRTRSGQPYDPSGRFDPEFAALTLDGARWVAERGIHLIGIDAPSIQRFEDPFDTHDVLLDRGIVILEGLDLSAAPPGAYELICLPLRLVGSDGAPARAVLRTSDVWKSRS